MTVENVRVEQQHNLGAPSVGVPLDMSVASQLPEGLAASYEQRRAQIRESEQAMWDRPDRWALEGVGSDTLDPLAGGLCSQTDPELFFPEPGANGRQAKKLCARCPLIDACLIDAVGRGETYGIWGGVNFSYTKDRDRAIRMVRLGLVAPSAGGTALAA